MPPPRMSLRTAWPQFSFLVGNAHSKNCSVTNLNSHTSGLALRVGRRIPLLYTQKCKKWWLVVCIFYKYFFIVVVVVVCSAM